MALRSVLLILLLASCTSRVPSSPEPKPSVVVAPAVEQLIALLHARMMRHSVLPDAEVLLCVRGRVDGNTVIVTGVHPAFLTNVTAYGLRYVNDACLQLPDYLGTFHTHPSGACDWSATDTDTWSTQSADVIQIVSCESEGRVAYVSRVRGGYSRKARQ